MFETHRRSKNPFSFDARVMRVEVHIVWLLPYLFTELQQHLPFLSIRSIIMCPFSILYNSLNFDADIIAALVYNYLPLLHSRNFGLQYLTCSLLELAQTHLNRVRYALWGCIVYYGGIFVNSRFPTVRALQYQGAYRTLNIGLKGYRTSHTLGSSLEKAMASWQLQRAFSPHEGQ